MYVRFIGSWNISKYIRGTVEGEIIMKPKAIPLLTDEQFAVLEKELERKPSAKDVERIKRAKIILKRHSF